MIKRLSVLHHKTSLPPAAGHHGSNFSVDKFNTRQSCSLAGFVPLWRWTFIISAKSEQKKKKRNLHVFSCCKIFLFFFLCLLLILCFVFFSLLFLPLLPRTDFHILHLHLFMFILPVPSLSLFCMFHFLFPKNKTSFSPVYKIPPSSSSSFYHLKNCLTHLAFFFLHS